jgi:hypothetical protein
VNKVCTILITVGALTPIEHMACEVMLTAVVLLPSLCCCSAGPCTSEVAAVTHLLKEVQEVVSLGLVDVSGEDLAPLRAYGLDTAALAGDQGCEVQLLLFPAGEDKQEQEGYLR